MEDDKQNKSSSECSTQEDVQSIKLRDQNIDRTDLLEKDTVRVKNEIMIESRAAESIPLDEGKRMPENIHPLVKLDSGPSDEQAATSLQDQEEPEKGTQDQADLATPDEAPKDDLPATENGIEQYFNTDTKISEEPEHEEESVETATVSCKDVTDSELPTEPVQTEDDLNNKIDDIPENNVEVEQEEENEETANNIPNHESNSSDEEEEEEDLRLSSDLQIKEDFHDYKSSLLQALSYYPKQKEQKAPVQTKVELELSTNVLSYERFYPGRILGNTFIVKNVGNAEAKFTLSFSNNRINRMQVGEALCDYYGCNTISEIEESYTKHLSNDLDTSEDALGVWFIEDPYTKRLTKTVAMELAAGDEYEFIVVLKSPTVNKQTLYAANVIVDCEQLRKTPSVFCFGCMEALKVVCPKEMYNNQFQAKMVKVVIRRKVASGQPIKVLLENKGDMQVSASFNSIEMENNLSFYLPRDSVSIEPKSRALLELRAIYKKVDNKGKGFKKGEPEVYHKLLIAKVKDCELKFSLIFEVTVI